MQILLRVMLLTALITGAIYSHLKTDYVVTPLMFGLLGIISFFELIWYLRRAERGWSQFLLAVKHQDFNLNFDYHSRTHQLYEAYRLISTSFERLRSEKQAEHRLLNTVVSHVPIGLACCKKSGEVLFANKAFKSLLSLDVIIDIETLKSKHRSVYNIITDEDRKSGTLVEINPQRKVLVKTESFALKGEQLRLISMTDIKSTLDTQELENYQKLMRVMTHEIMNSATPILSLIRVVNEKLIDENGLKKLDLKNQKNTAVSLNAIEDRTQGMLKFVEAYRKINKDFVPQLSVVQSNKFIKQIRALVINQCSHPIEIEDQVNSNISIDVDLMCQVMLNLIKNASHALNDADNPRLGVIFKTHDSHDLEILIEDNGKGISEANVQSIYVPFFTTKADGSGIGLPLSRKIIRSHGGNLSHQRINDTITQFRIIILEAVQ